MRGIGVGGKPFTVSGVYREIERPRLLVFTWLPDWQQTATARASDGLTDNDAGIVRGYGACASSTGSDRCVVPSATKRRS
jgi:uncharacterized protein YndB with AHSA1/START domain